MSRKRLPGILGVLAELVGEDAALTVAWRRGGARLNVPDKAESDGELAQLIGLDKAAKISRAYGGERVHIPMAKHQLILWLRAKGKSVREIVIDLRVSERTVNRTLNDNAPALTRLLASDTVQP